MEDEVANTWRIDGATRSAMRLARAQNALSDEDFETAILEAEELLDEDPTHGPALRLLGAALLESGDAEGSAQALTQYLSLGDPSAGVFIDLATARFESCDLPGAVEAAQRALELDASAAEAHFYLGMALDRLGERRGEAMSHLAAASQLEPERFGFPLELPGDAWEAAIEQALLTLHPALQEFWSGVPVVLQRQPELAELQALSPPLTPSVTGLYAGTRPEDADPWEVRPERLRLFIDNIGRAGSVEGIVEVLSHTLEAEARDWLGLGLDDPL